MIVTVAVAVASSPLPDKGENVYARVRSTRDNYSAQSVR